MHKINSMIMKIIQIFILQVIFSSCALAISFHSLLMFIAIPVLLLSIFTIFWKDWRLYHIAIFAHPLSIYSEFSKITNCREIIWVEVANHLDGLIPDWALIIWQLRLTRGMIKQRKLGNEEEEDKYLNECDMPWHIMSNENRMILEKLVERFVNTTD